MAKSERSNIKSFVLKLIPYIALVVAAFVSYHQLLQMYFWRDDYTGLYLSQKELIGNPAFAYPYQIALLLEKYAWQAFGLNAFNYFLTVIVFYITASWLLFYFLKRLFRDTKIAFFCSLVFAAGYIGQDAMKMTMGDGLGTIIALNMLLISLLTLSIYLQNLKKIWLICAMIAFFLTLEIAPQRTSSSLIIFMCLDWILSWKRKNWVLLLRNASFVLIFLIQYFLHPSVLLLGYKINPPTQFLGLLIDFSPLYLLNHLGTFWNMIIPSHLQEQFNTAILIYKESPTLFKFWLAGLPTTIFAATMFIYLKFLRPAVFSPANLGKILAATIIFSIVWALALYQIKIDKGDLVSIFNGGIFLTFLIAWISLGAPKFKLLSLFSLLTVFGIISIFFLTIPERILVSYNRYLLLPSFTIALLPIIFVTKEYFQADLVKKRLAQILFITIIFILVLPRLFTAWSTQQEFVRDYSRHAKNMYRQLRQFVPDISTKKIIYLEGTNKELNLSIGDAARVGYLGSEAALAVNYRTKKENIILPQTLGEIPRLLKENPGLNLEDVHTFIYGEKGLRETSQITRKLLTDKDEPVVVLPDAWEKNSFNPSFKIWTLLPIQVKLALKASATAKEKNMEIFWEYNTYGLLDQDKSIGINVMMDDKWHEYKFIIPGGGEYLKTMYFNIPSDVQFEIGNMQLNYLFSVNQLI